MNEANEVKGLNYYERHLGDYAKETRHLSLLEHGVYTILLDHCFATGKPIPEKQIYRYACARTRSEKRAVDAVLFEFFTLEDGWYFSNTFVRYMDNKDKRAQTSKENGKLGGRPPKKQDEMDKPNENNSLEKEKPNQNLTQTYQEPNPNLKKPVPIAINPLLKSKSKAQQQLIGVRADAAPPSSPVEGSPPEKVSAPPPLTADAEPASPNLPTASTATATAQAHLADRAVDSEIDFAALWAKLTVQARRVLLEKAKARGDVEAASAARWEQLNGNGQRRLMHVMHALLQNPLERSPLLTMETEQTGLAKRKTESLADRNEAKNDLETSLTQENDPGKGIIHPDPNPAKIEALENVSEKPITPAPAVVLAEAVDNTEATAHKPAENPAPPSSTTLTSIEFLQAAGLPKSIDLPVWQNFELMAREKVRWSAGTCSTLIRQLQQAMDAGADGNALLEWVTVRSLLDLPDAWQRMQSDAAKQGHADPLPADDVPVAEMVTENSDETASQTVTETLPETVSSTVIETVSPTPSQAVTETVSPTLAPEKPKQNLIKTYQEPKAKKKKAKREANKPHDVSDETWADFVEHRKNRKSLITDRVVEMFRKQAQKANISLDKAMQTAVMRGWIGFEAEWLEKNKRMQHAGNVAAHLIPNAAGRLPGESVSDAALRVFLETQEKRARGELAEPLKIGLFSTPSTPALPAPC